ncbi:DUF1963 domain-containing protein [Chenggangzhangella methanolivorans]|uniref:DUF1963 domain-containing protein n=1 Tax=Chenggangzhangella methanolivorans TaxID=1437009 RepID=UPI00361864E1
MARVETTAFSVEIDERFGRVVTIGTDLSARVVSDASFPPGLAVSVLEIGRGDRDKKGVAIVERRLARLTNGEKPFERGPIAAGGRAGVTVAMEDRLEDPETRKPVRWVRRQALFHAPEPDVFLGATASYAKADGPWVEAALLAMLGSLEFTVEAPGAAQALAEGDAALSALAGKAGAAMDKAAEEAARLAAEAAWAEVPDVEARFAAAIAACRQEPRRDALRALARPCVDLFEAGAPEPGAIGESRISGDPDLGEGIDWPRDSSGLHLNFLAQIDLAALSERHGPVPEAGLLSFFVGVDLGDGAVVFSPADAPLTRRPSPQDAEDLSSRAHAMIEWRSPRFVVAAPRDEELEAVTEPDGRIGFLRNGEPVVVAASTDDFSRAIRRLRPVASLGLQVEEEAYAEAGLDEEPYAVQDAVREAMAAAPSPRHRMFGLVDWPGGFADAARFAAGKAETAGWSDLAEPDAWFTLMELASGGEAGFDFGDFGTMIYLAPKADAARGDFSRVVAWCESH